MYLLHIWRCSTFKCTWYTLASIWTDFDPCSHRRVKPYKRTSDFHDNLNNSEQFKLGNSKIYLWYCLTENRTLWIWYWRKVEHFLSTKLLKHHPKASLMWTLVKLPTFLKMYSCLKCSYFISQKSCRTLTFCSQMVLYKFRRIFFTLFLWSSLCIELKLLRVGCLILIESFVNFKTTILQNIPEHSRYPVLLKQLITAQSQWVSPDCFYWFSFV